MQGSERRIPVQQPETGVCQNIIVSSDKILFVEFRPAGTVIIIEGIIQEVFFQVLQFRLQIFALGKRRFADTLLFNLIQADIKHQQPGNLWFPGLKEKNFFFRIRELVFGNGGFQQNKRHLYDINNLLNLI